MVNPALGPVRRPLGLLVLAAAIAVAVLAL